MAIVRIQLDRSDMALTSKVLVLLIIATAMAQKLFLPPVEFLKDFAMKYQRSSLEFTKEDFLQSSLKEVIYVIQGVSTRADSLF